jgi:membrane fusion protein (multidrug efflux system)
MAAFRSAPLLFLSLTLLLDACSSGKASPPAPAPPEVSVITAAPETVSISSEWIGTLDGYVNAQIRPQVSGYLLRRSYQEGVSGRAALFEIDPRPFRPSCRKLRAVSLRRRRNSGRLSAISSATGRLPPSATRKANSTTISAHLAAQAAIQSATAAIETAQLNLGFTKVMSLITGIAAIATAQIGDLVGPATPSRRCHRSIQSRRISLSEQEYLRIAGRINGPGTSSELWGKDASLTLVLADGSVYPRRGRFLAADRDIDPKTGTIRISAAFPNPARTLRPGQYARVRAETNTVADAIVVPQRGHRRARCAPGSHRRARQSDRDATRQARRSRWQRLDYRDGAAAG